MKLRLELGHKLRLRILILQPLIDIQFHFICWVIEQGLIRLVYCPTEDMVADTLTKPLPSVKVKHFVSALGLCSA